MPVMKLSVLELFLDCMTEPNEKLVEFGIGGICNTCADPSNAAVVGQSGGIPLILQYLSTPTYKKKISVCSCSKHGELCSWSFVYLCNASSKKEILKPEVVGVLKRYASSGAVSVSFSNLAQAFLDKHAFELKKK